MKKSLISLCLLLATFAFTVTSTSCEKEFIHNEKAQDSLSSVICGKRELLDKRIDTMKKQHCSIRETLEKNEIIIKKEIICDSK